MPKLFFYSNFSCFEFNFERNLFFGFAKKLSNRGFKGFWCFLVLREKKNDLQSLVLVFVQKWHFRDH